MSYEPEFDPGQLPRPLAGLRSASANSAAPSSPAADDPENTGRQFNYLEIAWRYRWWVAAAAVIGVVLGQLLYWKMGPTYEASAQILVSRKNHVPMKPEERTLQDWGDRSEHLALILSPLVAKNAVEIGQLQKLPTFEGEDDPVELVLEALKVKRSAGQDRSFFNVLNISYVSEQPNDARCVVEAVIKAYDRYLEETRKENSGEVYRITKKASDELLADLKQKEAAYLKFRQSAPLTWRTSIGATGAGGDTGSTNVHQERIVTIEDRRKLNLIEQIEVQSKIKSLEAALARNEPAWRLEELVRLLLGSGGGQSSEEVRRQQELNIFDQRLLPLILEEQKLTRRLGPDHPDVLILRRNIGTTVDYFRQQGIRLPSPTDGTTDRPELSMVRLYKDSLQQELNELKLREADLNTLFEDESTKAKGFAKYQAEDATLSADVTRTRTLWEQMVSRLNTTGLDRENNGYSLRQIAPAKTELVFKRLLKLYGAGFAFALAVFGAIAFLKELRDTRLRQPAEVRALTGQPVLGTVAEFVDDLSGLNDPYPQFSPSLRYLQAPNSMEAENYRALRAAVLHAAEAQEARVLQISSPEPGDGKSTLLGNLAIAIAQSGQRVLLIDGDLRHPSVHHLFGLSQRPGLTDVLLGQSTLSKVVQKTAIEGLSLVTAGALPENPSELLSSGRLKKLLMEVRPQFDLVLIDGPPLLAVSDPSIIARHIDGLLLVCRIGKNHRRAVQQTRELLTRFAVPMLGVVANGLPADGSGGYGYQGYYAASDEPAESATARRSTEELVGV